MGKIAVFLFDQMTDYEAVFAAHLLRVDGGLELLTLSYDGRPVQSASGLRYQAEQAVADARAEALDGLILCGGWYGEAREELLALIRALDGQKKLLAGICGAGTVFLARSGVLDHVSFTTPAVPWTERHARVFGVPDPFPRENYVPARVVTDGNVITALGTAFVDFAAEVCDWFGLFSSGEEKAAFLRLYQGGESI